MTPATLSPQNLPPFSRGAERKQSVQAQSNLSIHPAPAPPASSFHPKSPLPTRHRGAQSVTPAAPGKEPKRLDQVNEILRTFHYSVRTIQELLGHADLNTTMIYTHVVNKGPLGVKIAMTACRKLQPGQPGTKKLVARYGETLLCVRYRYDFAGQRRLKTVELVVEEAVWQPPEERISPSQTVRVWIPDDELDLRRQVQVAHGKWNQQQQVWELPYREVVELGLTDFILE